jgi:hypothetical protein
MISRGYCQKDGNVSHSNLVNQRMHSQRYKKFQHVARVMKLVDFWVEKR